MKKLFLTILIVLLPILSMAFSFNNTDIKATINNVSSVSSTDSTINMTDRKRIWKWFKRKKQKEDEEENNNQ